MSNKQHRAAIGLLVQDLGLRLFLGAAEAAREQDVNLFCYPGEAVKDPDPEIQQANIAYDLVSMQDLDALALWGGSGAGVGLNLNQEEMDQFIQRYAPLPIVNYERKIEGIPCILTNVYQGMSEAVRHLIEVHQRQKIALVWGPAGHFETEERVHAFHDTLAEFHLEANLRIISNPVDWSSEGGEQAIEDFLHNRGLVPGKDFDAILTTDAAQAEGVLKVLHRNGVNVPDDVIVLGFDEREESRLTTPPLTTVKKPFYKVGKRLIQMASLAASGEKIPEIQNVSTQLRLRRSCGCIDPTLTQASFENTQTSQEKFDIIINTRRAAFQAEIVNVMKAAAPQSDLGLILTAVEIFIKELAGEETTGFTRALEKLLNRGTETNHLSADPSGNDFDGSTWQNMISSMQRGMLPYLEGKKRILADALWNQARILIGETAHRIQANQAYHANQQTQILRQLETELSTAFNLETLANILAKHLPRLGIRSGYLSLYEDPGPYLYPDPAPEWSRLVMAYCETGRIELSQDTVNFQTRKLVPEGLLPSDRQYCFLVLPLYFRDLQQGFLLLEVGPQDETIFRSLQFQVASAIYGASLVNRIEERAVRLEAAAQVSRAASSILNPDELIQQTVKLIQDRFNLYYTGMFLLDETGRYAVLRAGTGEAGKQMLSQDYRLAVGDGSMIGWCIANQKARIALDVGQDSVRFENPILPATRSELALPLLARGVPIGALTVQSEREAAFSGSDITILQSLADQLANALDNARLIEARQDAENALRESELLYTSLVENMNFNVFRKDLQGRYTYVNEAFCKSMHTTRENLIGKTDFDFSPRETAEKYRADDAKVIESGKPLEVIEEHVLMESTGTVSPENNGHSSGVRYIQTLKAPVRNVHGEITGIQAAFWDISEQRIAELDAERRAVQLQTATEISRAASSLLDVADLTRQAVNLICNRFDLYYVGLFLIDRNGEWTGEPNRWAVLRAGTGEAGDKMLNEGHKLEIGGASMVGECITNASPQITLDTLGAEDLGNGEPSSLAAPGERSAIRRFKNPLLPNTRSEVALPLISRGQVLGALSIQSVHQNAFNEEDISILQSMADQLANAIANASLYEQTQSALREMETIYRRYLVGGWSEYSHNRNASGYRKHEAEMVPLGDDLLPEVQQILTESADPAYRNEEEEKSSLVVPIKLRNYPIGAIGLKAEDDQHYWSEDELSLIEILSEQFALAAENIRLLEETQRRAEREHMVSEITSKLRLSNDPQTIMQTAASELRRALSAKNARILVESFDELSRRREHGNGVNPTLSADNRGEQ